MSESESKVVPVPVPRPRRLQSSTDETDCKPQVYENVEIRKKVTEHEDDVQKPVPAPRRNNKLKENSVYENANPILPRPTGAIKKVKPERPPSPKFTPKYEVNPEIPMKANEHDVRSQSSINSSNSANSDSTKYTTPSPT